MRVLLDECVPAQLRAALPGHSVRTASEAGYRSFKDTAILAAASGRFDVIITVDRRISEDPMIDRLAVAVILVRARSNSLKALLPLAEKIQQAIQSAVPGHVAVVS